MRRFFRYFSRAQLERTVSGVLLCVLILLQCTFLPDFMVRIAYAAVVTIDATASTAAAEHINSGSQTVFISDQVGYKFYTDSTGVCVYSKTSNGGTSWGAQVTVDAQTDCDGIAVWYDQWTPNDYGSYIHIATMESGSAQDRLFYNRLDTTSDTLLMGTAPVVTTTGQVPTLVAGTNSHSLTKGADGVLYMTIADASDAFVVRCSASCNTTGGWSEAGTNPLDVTNDFSLLQPLIDGKILLINRDTSADDIRSKVWDGASWSGSWTAIDTTARESPTYDVGMSAFVDPSDGTVYLAYAADNDNTTTADHDVRTAKYVTGSWSLTTNVFTNYPARALHDVAIAQDTNTGTIYVAYTTQTVLATLTTTNVYYATSTTAMGTWSAEQGPVNTTPGDLYGLSVNPLTDERIYATWFDPSPDDVFGNTIADVAPITKVSTLNNQVTTLQAGTSSAYLGGTFVIKENQSSRNVTDITVSELGSADGSTEVSNIKLRYDLDTSNPYDCASESYSGSETQFGTTDSNGFSGADGVSSFTGFTSISTTQTMCVYVVMDVSATALDGNTIDLSVAAPPGDVLVSGGILVSPAGAVGFVGSTTIINHERTQTHYHWRNDSGTEATATSSTSGVADTALAALAKNNSKRLRMQVSNEGSLTTPASQYRLEYGEMTTTCSDITAWTNVGSTTDAWDMFNSANLTEGANTTNISVATGGVADENTTFLTPNGGVRDTTSQTGSITLTSTQFVEMEYSIVPTASSTNGATYCFRLTDAGTPLSVYSAYPQVTVSADVTLSASGTQATSIVIPSTNQNVGGMFVLRENVSSRNVTSITITETGSVDASSSLDNILLRYDLDTTAPYNCASESYAGSETQFGATDTNGFSGDNGSSTFSGSVNITTTRAMCVYVVLDVTSAAANAETIDIEIAQGGDDIGLSSGTIAPLVGVPITGSTTLAGSIITQSDFHWRLDNGSEVTASSATNGIENTVLTEHSLSAPIRLRVGVYNNGSATSSAQQLQLEFGPKVTTCSAVSVWTAVESASDDWDMATSSNLTEGANTTNIAVGNGGVTDRDTTFITANAGVREISDTTSGIVFSPSNYTDLEYSIKSTNITLYDTTYCFRVTNLGTPLPAYTQLGEIRTAPLRDFKIQRGDTMVSGTSTTLRAGINYTAPASTTTAFVRITNTHYTGSGRDTAGGGAQNNDDVSAYISASNLGTSFTISRPTAAISNTKVTWEIIEFIGEPGTDNQMSVRNVGTVSMGLTQTVATGTTGILVGDDADVVVFVTGIRSADTGRNVFYAQQVTSAWNATSNAPVFTRGSSGAVVDVSYAVVDFSGINWQVQRVEHTYASSTITETESIAPVNGLTRTFIHAQKRMGALGNVNNFGHEVWLSSIGSLSFKLEPLATTPSGHVSVAWVIENFQTSGGAMYVQRSNGTTDAGTEPFTQSVPLFVPIEATNNTTIHSMSRVVGANSNFPLPQAGAYINSTSTYTLWRSEATGQLTYRTEIVEWPINGLAVRQNYYRFYEDNDALLPTDPWPPGGTDLGENTSITAVDEPLGDGDRVRLRMSLKVSSANLPAGLYDFKLQYGQRVTSCATVADWSDVGDSGSGSIWRAYDAAGVVNGTALSAANPPTVGDVLLSVSDVAGSYVENSPSPQNPYSVLENNDIEYDWNLEHNGALERTVYCFRMVRADGTPIDGYLNYPQIRTAGFSPITKSWRWYDDATSTTPTAALAAQSVAPIEIQNGNTIALRVTVGERRGVPGLNVKFRLEYDEDPNFSNPKTPSATSTCTATSTWCYAAGGGLDNATITAKVLTDADTCTAGVGSGCGKHNSSATFVTGDTHLGGTNREYAFYITHAAARVGAVYYFRLYDIYNDQPVVPTASSTSPSLVAETAKLTLSVGGLGAGTTTSGVVLTATSTSAGVTFGTLPVDQNAYAAQRVSITTNATEGYRVLMYSPQQLLNTYGVAIPAITGTNAVPVGWAVGCQASSTGCVGYHTTDPTLQNGSTRFAAVDSYAALSATPAEVMYSPIPVNESHDILYRVFVRALQPAGNYETDLVYIAVPTY